MRFELCTECGRHIKVGHGCPFCGAAPTVGSAPPSVLAVMLAVPLFAAGCTSANPQPGSSATSPTRREAPKPSDSTPDNAEPKPEEKAPPLPTPAPAYGGPDMFDPPPPDPTPEPTPNADSGGDSKVPEGNDTAAESSDKPGKPNRAKRLYGAPPRRDRDRPQKLPGD